MILAEKIYYAIQGEGKNIGQPVIFLRTMGCNLKCTWCDTKYTWHPDHRKDAKIKKWDIKELAEHIREFDVHNIEHLVITGGEPTLQADAIIELSEILFDYDIEIETNGTQVLSDEFFESVDQINVSLKRKNSGNDMKIAENCKAIDKFNEHCNVDFKFVISEEKDLEDVDYLKEKYQLFPKDIYLMPEGVSEEEIIKKTPWLMEECIERGYNFTTRLHILAYGKKRFV